MKMKTKVLRGALLKETADCIVQEALQSAGEEGWIGLVLPALTGERLAQCDEGVVFEDAPLGIVTIAPKGVGATVGPMIMGIHIRPSERGRGYGTSLLAAAVRRCIERGFSRVHVDAMSPAMLRCTRKLPEELRQCLEVTDWSQLF